MMSISRTPAVPVFGASTEHPSHCTQCSKKWIPIPLHTVQHECANTEGQGPDLEVCRAFPTDRKGTWRHSAPDSTRVTEQRDGSSVSECALGKISHRALTLDSFSFLAQTIFYSALYRCVLKANITQYLRQIPFRAVPWSWLKWVQLGHLIEGKELSLWSILIYRFWLR